MIARVLVALAVLGPAVGAGAVTAEARSGPSEWTRMVRLAGSHVCHQRPERSFRTAGVWWPVCARCAGLYFGAASAAWLGLTTWSAFGNGRVRQTLVVAGAATAVTWMAEWLVGLPVTNGARFAAALPLGAAIGAAIVRAASGRLDPIR